jgi:hypothetical protein
MYIRVARASTAPAGGSSRSASGTREAHAQVPRDAFAELTRRLEAAGVQAELTEFYEETTPA